MSLESGREKTIADDEDAHPRLCFVQMSVMIAPLVVVVGVRAVVAALTAGLRGVPRLGVLVGEHGCRLEADDDDDEEEEQRVRDCRLLVAHRHHDGCLFAKLKKEKEKCSHTRTNAPHARLPPLPVPPTSYSLHSPPFRPAIRHTRT